MFFYRPNFNKLEDVDPYLSTLMFYLSITCFFKFCNKVSKTKLLVFIQIKTDEFKMFPHSDTVCDFTNQSTLFFFTMIQICNKSITSGAVPYYSCGVINVVVFLKLSVRSSLHHKSRIRISESKRVIQKVTAIFI